MTKTPRIPPLMRSDWTDEARDLLAVLQDQQEAGRPVRQVDAPVSMTLVEVLRDEGFEIEALLLDDSAAFLPAVSRLSCQIRVTDQMEGLEVTIAPAD